MRVYKTIIEAFQNQPMHDDRYALRMVRGGWKWVRTAESFDNPFDDRTAAIDEYR